MTKKSKDECIIELNGEVNLILKENGEEVERILIDPKQVLEIVHRAIAEGVALLDK